MKITKFKLVITSMLVMFNFMLFAENHKKTDSLLLLMEKAKHDTTRLRILDMLIKTENDSMLNVGFIDQMITITQEKIAANPIAPLKNIYLKFLANAFHKKGLNSFNHHDYFTAMDYNIKSLKIRREINIKIDISKSLNNIGLIYKEQGDISKAIEYYNNSLKIFEGLNDINGISATLTNIGVIYFDQRDMQKAFEYYNKSLKFMLDKNETTTEQKRNIANTLNNIGNIYYIQKDFPKALDYFKNSLRKNEELNDQDRVSYSLNNIGSVYQANGNFDMALDYYIKSLKIFEKLGNKSGVSTSLNNIGVIYNEKNNTQKALDFVKRAYDIAKEIGCIEDIRNTAKILDELYAKQNNFKLSRQFYGEYVLMCDSINKEDYQKLLQKKYFQYQYEKKAVTDSIVYSKAMEIKNIDLKKQKIAIWFVVSGLILLAIIAIIIFRSLHITRKQKKIIENQKQTVDKKNIQLNRQNEEITTQRDMVTKQKDQIEIIHREITDSINYAKRIQNAVLPTIEYANNILGENFILFKPKDVVSGDFFWTTCVNEWLIVTVADCTGHGVPGAFMSMLGISFLNEIVRKKEVIQASQVLDQLRNSVIDALKQKGENYEQKDGMDIALVVINTETFEIQFAGANNPLWIVKKVESYKVESYKVESYKVESYKVESEKVDDSPLQTLQTFELYELKGDKQPIGIFENMNPFSNRILKLSKGDVIYLASDGYEDQFGGPKHKKFLSKNMKDLLRANSQLPMVEQKIILEKKLLNWMGDNEQIDDITVLGIRI